MKLHVRLAVLLGLVQFGTGAAIASAQTQAPVTPEFTFKCADDSYPGQTLSDTTGIWADEINKRSHGRIHVDHFTSATLGSSVTLIQQLRLGAIEMVGSTVPNLAGIDGHLAAFTMPFLFEDANVARKAANGATAVALLGELEAQGIKGLNLGTNGFQVLTMRDKAILTPADLKGLRIRSLPSKIDTAAISALGANPTPIVYAQLYLALQNGTVDGTESSLSAVGAIKAYEVAKYISLTYHAWLPQIFIMNLKAFQSLPPDLQKVVTDSARYAADLSWQREEIAATKLVQDYTSRGMKINTIANRAAFRDLMRPVYDQMGPDIGTDTLAKLRQGR